MEYWWRGVTRTSKYQHRLAAANAALQDEIRDYWPPERALVDNAYAGFDWPFPALEAPPFELRAQWTLPRLLGYFSSYSASKRCREATGRDPVAMHAPALAAAWGDPDTTRTVRWPMFVHARRKEFLMFTGLVEGVGTLAAREMRGGDARLRIDVGTLPFDRRAAGRKHFGQRRVPDRGRVRHRAFRGRCLE